MGNEYRQESIRFGTNRIASIVDKAGPSGDYDGSSNTSIRDSKTSTLVIEDVYDVNDNCLKRLNNIRQGLNLPQFREYYECLPNAFLDQRKSNFCTISIAEGSGFSSEQTSPNSTFRHCSVNNNFTSTTSFNLIKDFNQQNSPCSRPDTATTEGSCDHYFICAQNLDFTNTNHQSISSIDPFTQAELHLDLTESGPDSVSSSSNTGVSPLVKKAHLSCDDVQIDYELSSFELRKVGPVNNWSTALGISHPEGASPLSARCLEIPPKRMRIRLNTPRFSVAQGSPSAVDYTSQTKPPKVQEYFRSPDLPKSVPVRNYDFRGCLSAVDGPCEPLANSQPRVCKSNQSNKSFQPITFTEGSNESHTQYFNTSTPESFSQIYKEIQACINPEEESKKTLSCKSSTEVSNLNSQEEFELTKVPSKDSKLMFCSRHSDISSSSKSTTSYELKKTSKQASYLLKSHKTSSSSSSVRKSRISHQISSRHASASTVNSLIEDFNQDSDECNNCEVQNHYSIRPSTCSFDNVQNLQINIPSSIEDEEFVNVNAAPLEPNITVIESTKPQQHSKFRFWRFKRRKDRLGSGDTSDSPKSDSQATKSSRSYIVSPALVKMHNNKKLHLITKSEKPDERPRKSLSRRCRSKDSIEFEEEEIGTVNYSDFCLPIKSLDKLPDEKSVRDILQSMSQSIFKKSTELGTNDAESVGDCNDFKEDAILRKFSDYSHFKTRAELLAEHVKETELDREEIVLSKVLKEATYPIPPSSSDDNSETNDFLNRRKQQNTQIRFYEVPSPMNSTINLNQEDKDAEDETSRECKHLRIHSDDTIVKIDNEDDDIPSGFCGNCFCKNLLFPKMSRTYFR